MATKDIEIQDEGKVTFYAIRPDGKQPATGPTIFWPFSTISDGHTPVDRNQALADQAKNIRFENGHFITEDKDQIWLLDHYNSGGTYKDKRGNELYYGGERLLMTITRKDPNALDVRTVEKKVETVVEKVVYPRVVLESMDPKQLTQICVAAGLDFQNIDQTNSAIIKFLEDKGFVQG